MLGIHRNPWVRAGTFYTTEKAIGAALFYVIASRFVKNKKALKWICFASIAEGIVTGFFTPLAGKRALHGGKIEKFFSELIPDTHFTEVLLSGVFEYLVPQAAALAITPIVGIWQGEEKVALIAWILLDILLGGKVCYRLHYNHLLQGHGDKLHQALQERYKTLTESLSQLRRA